MNVPLFTFNKQVAGFDVRHVTLCVCFGSPRRKENQVEEGEDEGEERKMAQQ